jgi:hypothetical protein
MEIPLLITFLVASIVEVYGEEFVQTKVSGENGQHVAVTPCLQREVDVTMRVETSVPSARSSEEPCAGKPHAGICEGNTRQLLFLP